MTRWATFDCYGTLIDWNGGLDATFERLWPGEDVAGLLGRYHQIEPAVQQAGPALRYREVMARCLRELADEWGLPLDADDEQALGRSLPEWPAFPEVPETLAELRRRGWRLAILSNTDADLLATSIEHLGTPIDERVIASEIGSYKPAPGHWREFSTRTGARAAEHVHVGASLYHDMAPATTLGIRTVWINRLGEKADQAPTRVLPDLRGLPDVLDELIAST